MREILFRGLCGEVWCYGSLVNAQDGVFILEEGYLINFSGPTYHSEGMGCGLEDKNIIDRYEAMSHGWECAVERYESEFPEYVEVTPESVGQCTGIKDGNGNDIYEGDIIRLNYGIPPTYDMLTVVWKDVGWFMENNDSDRTSGFLAISYLDDIAVVGNIHQSPQS